MSGKWIVVTGALMLAACNGAADKDSAAADAAPTPAPSASAPASLGKALFRPGEWETTVELIDVDIPGMPAGSVRDSMVEMMKKTKTTTKNCVTKEDAEKPEASVFTGSKGKCSYDRMTMSGGKIDAVMTCVDASGRGKLEMTSVGTYDDTSFTMTNDMRTTAPGQSEAMHMKAKVTGKRTGDCAG